MSLEQVREKIREAALKAGRKPEDIALIAVSKTMPAEKIADIYKQGVRAFGENKVQELTAKKSDPLLAGLGIEWHMIGSLQTNKVKQVVGETVMIHSLDRPELAQEIERQAEIKKIPQVDCLIQVNCSGETSKQGLAMNEVESFAAQLKEKRIKIRGLMTIGPLTDDGAKIRAAFRSVKELQQSLKKKFPERDWSVLSMGMSGDYTIAIEEGATLLRIGSAIFGPRPVKKEPS